MFFPYLYLVHARRRAEFFSGSAVLCATMDNAYGDGPWNTGKKFKVINGADGEEIKIFPLSDRIYKNTSVEWLLPHVAKMLSLHKDYVHFIVKNQVYTSRGFSQTLMKDLVSSDDESLTLHAIKIQPPQTFLSQNMHV